MQKLWTPPEGCLHSWHIAIQCHADESVQSQNEMKLGHLQSNGGSSRTLAEEFNLKFKLIQEATWKPISVVPSIT